MPTEFSYRGILGMEDFVLAKLSIAFDAFVLINQMNVHHLNEYVICLFRPIAWQGRGETVEHLQRMAVALKEEAVLIENEIAHLTGYTLR